MFQPGVQARVDGLCQGWTATVASKPDLFSKGKFSRRSQSGGGSSRCRVGVACKIGPRACSRLALAPARYSAADPRTACGQQVLGAPSSKRLPERHALRHFPAAGRLAEKVNGERQLSTDTSGHQSRASPGSSSSGWRRVMFSTGTAAFRPHPPASGEASQHAPTATPAAAQAEPQSTERCSCRFHQALHHIETRGQQGQRVRCLRHPWASRGSFMQKGILNRERVHSPKRPAAQPPLGTTQPFTRSISWAIGMPESYGGLQA